MNYIKKVLQKNITIILIYIGLGIFNAFMANFKADYFQQIIDGLSARELTLKNIIIYGSILISIHCMSYLDNYPDQKLEQGIYLDFKLLALKKISTIDYMAYQKIGTGKLVQRIESGASAGRNVLYNFWLRVIRDLLPTIIFSIYFIWNINKGITYALLIGYVIIFITTNLLLKFLYQIKEKILNNEELLNHYLVRGFMEMLVFRVNNQFPAEIIKAQNAKNEIVSSKVKMRLIHEAFFTIFVLIVDMLNISILIYVWSSKSLSVGSMVALFTLIENAYTPIAIFNVIYVQYKLDKASYARFEQFLCAKDDMQLTNGTLIKGNIEDISIRNLSFQFEERQILNEICLSVKKGEKIALVGESGSGKSTLVKIMVGLLKYNNGQLHFNKVSLNEICLNELYNKVTYLSQDAPIFDGTIKENVVFDSPIADDQILEALSKVQLSYLLKNVNNGLYTEIGEKGTCLSGGEKQRLALSRLWFKESELVILDEATSALDNLTEENVMREVILRLKEQTVIAIAHRLNSIVSFDRIIVLRDGKIIGQGTFEELITNNDYFLELYNSSMQQ